MIKSRLQTGRTEMGENRCADDVLVWGPAEEGERTSRGRLLPAGWVWTCGCGAFGCGYATESEAEEAAEMCVRAHHETPPRWRCPWCTEAGVPSPGMLCSDCAQEPDAVEFKAAHDAECTCTAAIPKRQRRSGGHKERRAVAGSD